MFENSVLKVFRADGRTYGESGDECAFNSETIHGESGKAFKITARLHPDTPRMKSQSGFPRDCAVQARLPVAASRFLAVYQHKEWWQRPAFAAHTEDIPKCTQLLMWRHDGEYHVLLALCGADYRADIHGENGEIVLTLSSNKNGMMLCESVACVHAQGKDPYKVCEDAVSFGIQLSHSNGKLRREKRYPEMFEYLGWCTWDAFYQEVNGEGVLSKLAEFKEKKLPLQWVLIDDGWSQADYTEQELAGLDAEEEKFSGGMEAITRRIKGEGVAHVGVWQAAMGYWNGVKPDSKAHSEMSDYLLRLPDGRLAPNPDQSFQFWNVWHSHLAKQGVDFVKIDEQSAPSIFYAGTHSYGEAARKTQDGLGASAGHHFDGNAIHCMGMAPQEFWARASAAIIRTSDDFVPSDPQGFAEHCIQNAYCSLLTGPMYWGDWDMFWSKGKNSVPHSMLRAVSGGPVYISDKVGETDADTIRPLTDKDGKLLRCDAIGLPTIDCLLQNPFDAQKPMKIWNKRRDVFLVAAFAGDDTAVCGSLRLDELSGAGDGEYIWYDWNGKKAGVLGRDGELPIALEAGESAIFQLVSRQEVCTPLGLVDKYLGYGMIQDIRQDGETLTVLLKEGGRFGYWMQSGLHIIDCPQTEAPTIEINLQDGTVISAH